MDEHSGKLYYRDKLVEELSRDELLVCVHELAYQAREMHDTSRKLRELRTGRRF